jgi:hypothetical protein
MLMIALKALQIEEITRVFALASAYRFLAMMKTAASLIGVGAAIAAIAASFALMQSGGGPIPVGQTSGGTSRQVSATGMAVIHAGETISRAASGQGGSRGGGNINITIGSADMSYRAGIEETARDLGTLIYQGYRRIRH